MAITTLDQLIAGCRPPQFFHFSISGAATSTAAGQERMLFSSFRTYNSGGIPYQDGIDLNNEGNMPALPSGAALTSLLYSSMPFQNAAAGKNLYLSHFSAVYAGGGTTTTDYPANIILVDRVWHSGYLSWELDTPQTVNSVPFAARDANGTTNGEGVFLFLEFSQSLAAPATFTVTINYTNSDGVNGRTKTQTLPNSNSINGTTYLLDLQDGDKGVRSVQSITLATGFTGGAAVTVNLAAQRIITSVQTSGRYRGNVVTPVSGGLPRLYNNSVLGIVFGPMGAASNQIGGVIGSLTIAEG